MILILTNIPADCPNNENKERGASKKGKAKKVYIAWQDNEVSSSSSSSGDKEANLCLIGKRRN